MVRPGVDIAVVIWWTMMKVDELILMNRELCQYYMARCVGIAPLTDKNLRSKTGLSTKQDIMINKHYSKQRYSNPHFSIFACCRIVSFA
jgi:hypothetical protein